MLSYPSRETFNTVRLTQFILIGFSVSVTMAISYLASQEPIFVVLAMVGMVLAVGSIVWPDITVFGFFLIFLTNTAVIAVRFHNVPYVVGAVFPLLLFVPLSNYILNQRQKILFVPTIMLLLFYLFVNLLGIFRAVEFGTALDTVIELVVEGILLYVLIINVVRNMDILHRVIVAFLVSTFILGAVPLFQEVTKTYDNNYGGYAQVTGRGFDTGEGSLTGEVIQERLEGAIGEKNFFAQIMLMLGMISLTQISGARTRKLRLLAMASAGLAFIAVTLTFSRGAAVALAGTIFVATLLSVITWRQLGAAIAIVIVLLLAFPQFSVRLLSIQESLSFATGSGSTSDQSTRGRATQMLAALIIFTDHPVIGVGPNQYRNYVQDVGNELGIKRLTETRQAHNLYLDVASNSGLLGFTAIMGIFFLTLRDLNRVRKRWMNDNPELAAIASGFILAIISFLISGLFLHMSYERYLWVILAVAAATVRISQEVSQQHENRLKNSQVSPDQSLVEVEQ